MSASDGRSSWLLLGPNGATHDWTHQPRLVADDLLTLKLAILGGVGVGLLPDYMCHPDLLAGRLVPVLPGWNPRPGLMHAVFASRRGLAPAVRCFLDFLGERLESSRVTAASESP
jgi:DNA-binding transcriptional LysR family regulator